MIGGYLLGSDTEAISFEPDGVAYRWAGVVHAVDLDDPVNVHAASIGYAICGMPVRVWPDERFDSSAREAHDRCVALTAAAVPGGTSPG